MREDLIVRLRNFEGSDALGNGDFSLLQEAAAALEAAREDAERYRLLRRRAAKAEGSIFIELPGAYDAFGLGDDNVDAAIDHAREKGEME